MSNEIIIGDYLPVDLEDFFDSNGVSKLKFDKDLFVDGLRCGSYWAGVITALFNAGLEEDNVKELLVELINSTDCTI